MLNYSILNYESSFQQSLIINSKFKIEQFKIGSADNSKLKIQNSKLKIPFIFF